MNDNMTKALALLNSVHAATGSVYAIERHQDTYALLMPTGGRYPATDANAMVQRLVTLRICAEGRGA